ncbi:MAG TPA: hypothetical protein VET25_10410, partial [Aestuariivirgaceae bacterium]|nr:hypothetical protein [Aestuariivirgaceae bacterium]
MRVFVYEFVTGGGWWSLGSDVPPESLLAEGAAMARAVVEDFSRMGAEPIATLDTRLSELSL